MKTIFIIFFLCSATICIAQSTETKYYWNRSMDQEVEKEKAKYEEIITENNGVKTTTIKDLKKDEVTSSESWNGDEPVGTWVILTGKGPEPLDYNFELNYTETGCKDPADKQIKAWFQDDPAIGYTAPLIEGKDTDPISFIVRYLRYPAKARISGIEGTVYLEFSISEEGVIENILVTKGVHITLDKEAVRILRAFKFSKPPMLNGKAQKICTTFPLKYKLS